MNHIIYYKEIFNFIKKDKIMNGDIIIIPIYNEDVGFVVLNDVIVDNHYRMDIMSTIPLLKNIKWNNSVEYYKDFKHINFLKYKKSNINKELQSCFYILPKFIQNNINNPYVKELWNIDLLNNEVSFNYITLDKIWIPSVSQVFGISKFTNDNVLEAQYQYFKNSKNRTLYDENGNKRSWWLRSVNVLENNVSYVTEKGELGDCDPTMIKDSPICFRMFLDLDNR